MNDLVTQYAPLVSGPLDHLLSPPGQSAADELGGQTLNTLATGLHYLAHPSELGAAFGAQARHIGHDLNPLSAPGATPDQQQQRAYEAGANAGDTAIDLAAVADGPLELKYLHDLGYLGKAPAVETYLARGYPQWIAEHFAGPYTGRQGSHFIPQRSDLPKWLLDSPFNRIMPAPGATAGEAAESHFLSDNRYNGGRVKAQYGGGGWIGQRLGWGKPSAPVRWWRGMPLPTKIAGYGGLAALGSAMPQQSGTGR
jgi:hypothetical protein